MALLLRMFRDVDIMLLLYQRQVHRICGGGGCLLRDMERESSISFTWIFADGTDRQRPGIQLLFTFGAKKRQCFSCVTRSDRQDPTNTYKR